LTERLPHPLGRLPVRRQLVVLGVCLVLFAAFALAMKPAVDWMSDQGHSIYDFELAGDDAIQEVLGDWGEGATSHGTTQLVLDVPFLVGYGLGLAAVLGLLAEALRRWRRVAVVLAWLAWVPLAAALCDLVENVCLFLVLRDRVEGWPDAAAAAARAKFALLDVAYVAVVAGALLALAARLGNRRAPAPA